MPLKVLKCPSCGGRVSEYEPNKWACLEPKCGARVIYELPPTRTEIHTESLHRAEIHHYQHSEKDLEGSFECSACGGHFPSKTIHFPCKGCNRQRTCRTCYDHSQQCSACVIKIDKAKRAAESREAARRRDAAFFRTLGNIIKTIVLLPFYIPYGLVFLLSCGKCR